MGMAAVRVCVFSVTVTLVGRRNGSWDVCCAMRDPPTPESIRYAPSKSKLKPALLVLMLVLVLVLVLRFFLYTRPSHASSSLTGAPFLDLGVVDMGKMRGCATRWDVTDG
jgi:hypothetical protein